MAKANTRTGKNETTISEQLQCLSDDVKQLGALVLDETKGALGSAQERATDVYGSAKEGVAKKTDQALDYVRTEPLKAVLMAAGAGLLVGWLSRR